MNQEIDKQKLLENFLDEFHPLVELGKKIGPDALNDLMSLLGGEKPHIPTTENFWTMLERQMRNEQIRGEFQGNNYDRIAETHGLDETTVRKIVHHHKGSRTKELGTAVKINRDIHAQLKTLKTKLGAPSDRVIASALLKAAMESSDIVSTVREQLKATEGMK